MTNHARGMAEPQARDAEVAELPDTFESFFRRERDRLFGLLCLVTGDRSEAEEVSPGSVPEALGALGSDRRTREPGRLSAHHGDERVPKALPSLCDLPAASSPLVPGRDRVGGGRHYGCCSTMRSASWSPGQRAALVLTELLGFSAEEAAKTCGRQGVDHRRTEVPGPSKAEGDGTRRCLTTAR